MKISDSPSRCLVAAVLIFSFSLHAEENKDSFEAVNRSIFEFNDTADKWVLKPITEGYTKVTPDFIERGISNFFSNLKEFVNIPNDLLQGKFSQALNDTGRLLVNSTFGLAGFLNPASTLGLDKNDGEDFGQTLATWGVPSGPYIVVPFLGSSTVRDFPARSLDAFLFAPVENIDHLPTRNTILAVDILDTRAGYLESEKLITGDRYTFIKDAYLQNREFLVNDGELDDDFGSFGDEEDGYGDDY